MSVSEKIAGVSLALFGLWIIVALIENGYWAPAMFLILIAGFLTLGNDPDVE